MIEVQPGKRYEFAHTRKGRFVADVIALVPGDEADGFFIHVSIPTGPYSGQGYLANVTVRDAAGIKTTPEISKKNIRPSLITAVREVQGDGIH